MRLHQARLQQMTQDTKILSTLVDQLDKISDFEEEAKFNPILENLTSQYSTVSLQLINSKYNGMDEQSILNLIYCVDNLCDKIDTKVNQTNKIEKTEIQNHIAKANKLTRTQQDEIIASSIRAFLISLIIGKYISLNSIIKPLSIMAILMMLSRKAALREITTK
jgi:hypothetical protein